MALELNPEPNLNMRPTSYQNLTMVPQTNNFQKFDKRNTVEHSSAENKIPAKGAPKVDVTPAATATVITCILLYGFYTKLGKSLELNF